MKRMVERAISHFGCPMILLQGSVRVSFRGILRRFEVHAWTNQQRKFGPLGELPRGRYVLLAPQETELRDGDTLVFQGISYEVRRADVVRMGEKTLYCWGLCVEKGSAEPW